jgi:hypothetical protein
MAEIAQISPYIYLATFFFALSAISSDLLFIRISLMGGFLFLVLASLSGQSSDGSFHDIPLANGMIDIPMFVNMVLFFINLTIVLRLISDEQQHGKLTPEEEALFRFFQARSGMTPLQFQHVLQNGEFVEFPPDSNVPKCASTLYLVMEGQVSCKAKFQGDFFSHNFIKRSGEFFDIKLFNIFSLPVGFDNVEFHAKTITKTKCFRWNIHGLVAMREAKSPSLKEYWEYMVLTSMTGAAIRHHLKRDDTLYDSLMIPENKNWLDGAPSRDFIKKTATEAGTWDHWKYQFALMQSSLMQVIPPRGVRQHPRLPYGINPKQAYLELLCKTADAEYDAEEEHDAEAAIPTTIPTSDAAKVGGSSSKSKTNAECGHLGLSVAIVALLMVNYVNGLPMMNTNQKLVIVGLGRVGLEVAKVTMNQLESDDHSIQVVGTVRNLAKSLPASDGIKRIPFESDSVWPELMGSEDNLDVASHVLFAVPLQRETDPAMDQVWNRIQEWWNENPQGKLGILSTTGVYGDHGGGVVTEDSPLLCEDDSNASLYRQLEQQWIDIADHSLHSDSVRLFIFRCAGIYDATRSALHTVYNSGFDVPSDAAEIASSTSVSKTNRVHATDIARAVVNVFFRSDTQFGIGKTGSRVYNLADDEPENRHAVLSYAKELLLTIGSKIPVPTTSNTPTRSSATRQSRRAREQKLVDNTRVKVELLPETLGGLLYPTYKEGLRAILMDPSTPWQKDLGNS